MKINSLRIKNNFYGWEFEKVDFTLNLTLFVGISGVGKTQILNAIDSLRKVANGESINGLEWEIAFSIVSSENYLWKGAFSVLDKETSMFTKRKRISSEEDEIIKPTILFEELTDAGQNLIIERDTEKILFNGNPMPKLSSHESMVHILKEEKSIQNIVQALNKIKLTDHASKEDMFFSFSSKTLTQLKEKYKTLDEIKNSNEAMRIKLFLCYEYGLEVFEIIKERFMDIFPQVEDVKIEQTDEKRFAHVLELTPVPVIFIKEKKVSRWITEGRMSSGMLRTILHISELFLASDGSVILIDEFENSLGINCIDILTDDLIHENHALQFIATSHHPYIINNIPYEYWKVVSREGGHIKIENASSYNLGKSKQEAFIQLTKLLENQI